MPSVNLNITPQGPLLTAQIGVSAPRRAALLRSGLTVPDPVPVLLLIDTGASCTCLDHGVIGQLAITPHGVANIHTPSTNAHALHACHQYDVGLVIPHPGISRVFNSIEVLESSFKHQGIDGLLGRDVLRDCLFVYNGELNIYTLSF